LTAVKTDESKGKCEEEKRAICRDNILDRATLAHIIYIGGSIMHLGPRNDDIYSFVTDELIPGSDGSNNQNVKYASIRLI
jgi:hypothetical protein